MTVALIVAAGQGVRMGAERPKQFLSIAGRPILAHTISVFDQSPDIDLIVLCLAEAEIDYCRKEIVERFEIHTNILYVSGGARRQDSVYNGLQRLEGDHIVLIHDGVRPFVSKELIAECKRGAVQWGACLPAVPVTDTLKKTDSNGLVIQTISRKQMYMAQTPQAFRLQLIKAAHQTALKEGWLATDDASLVERMGEPVRVIPGAPHNIKITTPEDLYRAEAFMARSKGERAS